MANVFQIAKDAVSTELLVKWKMAYQITPIILTNGIAAAQGDGLPIVALTDGIGLLGLASQVASAVSGVLPNLDGFFANYQPLPGSTLISNQVAMYPFANQAVAANAIIAQPLSVSMLMTCPAGVAGSYGDKQTTMISLQSSLSQHNGLGGTYTIVTPSFIYTNCIMTAMHDVSDGSSSQVQFRYQLDFIQPLVSLQAAQQAQNGLMQTLTNGTPVAGTPTWSSGLPVTNPTNTLTSSLAAQPQLQ